MSALRRSGRSSRIRRILKDGGEAALNGSSKGISDGSICHRYHETKVTKRSKQELMIHAIVKTAKEMEDYAEFGKFVGQTFQDPVTPDALTLPSTQGLSTETLVSFLQKITRHLCIQLSHFRNVHNKRFIQRRVEDLQLGVESYQKKLNLTKPDTYRPELKRRKAYTSYSNPRGFIYQNKDKKNRPIRIDELQKFSDGILNDVRTALNDHLKRIQMEYLPQTIWRQSDKDKAGAMIQEIDK
ncbi:hypothetical protein Tco_1080260 [Tanacetum coccineum]|uniref:Uncharacterized protein n=1 Tax=Tanacetum coccineum TaxID=301880 RepID=A0ABQ5HUR6_9ASTR